MAAPNNRFWIDISIGLGKTSLHITIGYEGPGGSLAQYFTKGTKKKLKRTSFDALGLYIAQEVVNSLQYTGFGGKRNEFALSLTLPQSLEDHSE
ncbi:MAG: hypothetical protein HUN05_07785 [Desulfobacter sp.]|nr:MAG: hypothetical protein HUN05_07785 [Desulfobacter sp.]